MKKPQETRVDGKHFFLKSKRLALYYLRDREDQRYHEISKMNPEQFWNQTFGDKDYRQLWKEVLETLAGESALLIDARS